MFWWIFLIAWVVLLALLLFLQGLAQSRASGQGEPIHWPSTLGWTGGAALLFALVILGIISLF
jgi:hypothetical protein